MLYNSVNNLSVIYMHAIKCLACMNICVWQPIKFSLNPTLQSMIEKKKRMQSSSSHSIISEPLRYIGFLQIFSQLTVSSFNNTINSIKFSDFLNLLIWSRLFLYFDIFGTSQSILVFNLLSCLLAVYLIYFSFNILILSMISKFFIWLLIQGFFSFFFLFVFLARRSIHLSMLHYVACRLWAIIFIHDSSSLTSTVKILLNHSPFPTKEHIFPSQKNSILFYWCWFHSWCYCPVLFLIQSTQNSTFKQF